MHFLKRISYVILACLFLGEIGLKSSNSQEIYPFTDNANLSWSAFEKNFRENASPVDIPPIICLNDKTDLEFDFGPAVYIDKADAQWQNFVSKNPVAYQPPVIMINTKEIGSSALTGYTLWHEIGHHHYDPIVEKQRRENAKLAHIGTGLALLAGNAAYAYHNCKSIWNRNFTFKKGLTQASLLGLLIFKNEIFGNLINNFLDRRADEYFADSFANQHATLEMLQAAQHEFSVEGSIENYMHEKYPKEKWDAMNLKEQEDTRIAVDFTITAFYSLLDRFDIAAHLSNKKRHALVQKALKDRFGIEK